MSNGISKTFSSYQVIGEVGRGGMAIVYRAYQPSLQRYVALKVLAPQLTVDETFVQRFLKEATTAANLNHPNIITIYDVGEANGTYYFAMQYCPGGTLQDMIKREGALSPTRIVYITQQLASALDYAHRQSLIHRDIKPANVMVGDQDYVILTDFGIARAAEGSKLTQVGTVVGTPEYMSPEQAKGEEIDRRSDIYSLGVVIFEMFAGRVPFTATAPQAVLHKHAYETPPPLRNMARGIPRDVEKVVSKALAKDRRQRYQSAGELAYALAKACGIKMSMPVLLPPIVTPVPGKGQPLGGPTVGLPPVGGATTPMPGVRDDETRQAERLTPQPRVLTPAPVVKKGFPIAYLGLAIVGLAAVIALFLFARGNGGNHGPATPTRAATQVPATATPLPPIVIVVTATASGPTSAAVTAPAATVVVEATSTPAATVRPSAAPTAAPIATAKPKATPTPSLQPVLLSPPEGKVFYSNQTGKIRLEWSWPHQLATEEHFDVRIYRQGTPDWGITRTEVTNFEWEPKDTGKWYWRIAVIRVTGPDSSKNWELVGERSEESWFEYSSSPGDSTTRPDATEGRPDATEQPQDIVSKKAKPFSD